MTVPFTTTVTNHGLLISVVGEAVGAITAWSPGQSRTATPVFEFGGLTQGGGDDVQSEEGEPYEIVPGNIGGTEIAISRYDVYTKRFESAFRTTNLYMLTKQSSAIRFIEFTAGPAGRGLDFTNVYFGSWFTRLGRRHDAAGNRIVMADASAMYARVRPAQ